jgi:hypothetical protein
VDLLLYCVGFNNVLSILEQNSCVRATDELSKSVNETAGQLERPATLNFRTQALALERQTRLWELSKFQPIGTHQEEIAKKFCRFQIREDGTRLNTATQNEWELRKFQPIGTHQEEIAKKFCRFQIREDGTRLNTATQNAIGFAPSLLLGAHYATMLAQTETKSKAPFGNRNGRQDKSNDSDPQFAKLKKELTLVRREISKNQLHQAKENIAKERAERGSKSKKDDSTYEEVGSKRVRQQAKRAKASRPGTSPPSPPWKGFKMLLTGDNSDSEEEDDYPEQNARATYAV